jgi:hypothetical protein
MGRFPLFVKKQFQGIFLVFPGPMVAPEHTIALKKTQLFHTFFRYPWLAADSGADLQSGRFRRALSNQPMAL